MSEKMQSPFEKIYAPLPDVGAYLERIGYRGEVSSNLETLGKLMQCHLAAVPFENLDVFHGHLEPSLETERMFAKIVLNRRGGYCFELNGLFSKLLEAIGFSVSCTFARILFGRSFVPPKAHRVIIVEIQGEKYFCDIGFGARPERCPERAESHPRRRGFGAFPDSASKGKLRLRYGRGARYRCRRNTGPANHNPRGS